MHRLLKIYISLAILIMTTTSFAQNVNGHWYGIGIIQITNEYNSYLSEMVLHQKGRKISGELNYYFKDSLAKVNLIGSFDEQTHKLNIKPFALMYYRSANARNSIDCYMSG